VLAPTRRCRQTHELTTTSMAPGDLAGRYPRSLMNQFIQEVLVLTKMPDTESPPVLVSTRKHPHAKRGLIAAILNGLRHSALPPREGTLSDPQHLEHCTTTRPGSRSRAPDSGTCALQPDSGRMASLPTLRLRNVAMRSIAARNWRFRRTASRCESRLVRC
jgi:hypothetical protein